MKADEMRPCDGCGEALVGTVGTGKTGSFYRVEVSMFLPDWRAIRQIEGLRLVGLSDKLAVLMARNDEVAQEVPESKRDLLLCFACYAKKTPAELAEAAEAAAKE